MKRFAFFVCLAALFLLIPAGISAVTVTSITPSTALNTGTTSIQMNGAFISGTQHYPGLVYNGNSIQGTACVATASLCTSNFVLNGQPAGSYTLYVDGSPTSNIFTVTGTTTTTATPTQTTTSPVGPATQMAINSGNSQSATAGTTVAVPPSVIVKDVNGTPVSGVTVIFSTATGSGSVSGNSQTTGTNGIATVGSWTLGTVGTNTLTATSGSLSPVTFTATGTGGGAPTISGIAPNSGLNTSNVAVTITGSNFIPSGTTTVSLTRTGYTNITWTGTATSSSQITCTPPITGAEAGVWSVVVTNPDGQWYAYNNQFTVTSLTTNAPTISSIDPTSGLVNTTITVNAITGTNFARIADGVAIKLVNGYASDLTGSVTSVNSAGTSIAGTFNLNNEPLGTYQVCVYNTATNYVCGLSFTVTATGTTGTNGTIIVRSAPSGARVFLGNTDEGFTPVTLYNITPGSYTVEVLESGYNDYNEAVTVTSGNTYTVNPSLQQLSDTTEETTAPVVTATTVKTTTTVKKSTLKVPTSWPSDTPASSSPVDPAVLLGAVGIGVMLVVIRRP